MSNNLRDGIERIGYVGWVEFASCKATTHIACILANGSVYFPEGFDVADMTDFRNAEATGRFWPLVRGEWRGDPVPVLHRETKPDKSIQQERSAGMSNLLRDRIANTLYQELSIELPAAIRGADAVIKEMGLEQEESYMRPGWEGTTFHRYVTEWEISE